ncbi:MAG: recombinase family protein [Pirellulales bacterium]
MLGAFLKRVEAGDVPPGSWLIVEAIDRLSREPLIDALTTITNLIRHEITIVTLSPSAVYDAAGLNNGSAYLLVASIQLAHQESKNKSMRVQAARDQSFELARATGRVITGQCPAWLTPKQDRSGFEIIEAAKRVIQSIYQSVENGRSINQIVLKLNECAEWQPPPRKKADREAGRPGSGWRASYVKKILRNKAVIGEHQPHNNRNGKHGGRVRVGEPIPNYYPEIITVNQWHAVQNLLDARRGMPGRTGAYANVLRHLAKCAYCGGTMRYVNKGKPPKGAEYLQCDNGARCIRRNGKPICSHYHRVRLDETVKLVISNCKSISADDVLPTSNEHESKRKELASKIGELTSRIDESTRQKANLLDAIANTDTKQMREILTERLSVCVDELPKLVAELKSARQTLSRLTSSREHFSNWSRNLNAITEALATKQPQIRAQLNHHLKQLITRVEIFADGYPIAVSDEAARNRPENAMRPVDHPAITSALGAPLKPLQHADDIVDFACTILDAAGTQPPKDWYRFTEWLLRRRLSKEGRFVRIVFSTGAVADVAPEQSLASCMRLTIDGNWRHVSPDIGSLYEEYKRKEQLK